MVSLQWQHLFDSELGSEGQRGSGLFLQHLAQVDVYCHASPLLVLRRV